MKKTDEELYLDSLRMARIPERYIKTDLSVFGKLGKEFYDLLEDNTVDTEVNEGITYAVIGDLVKCERLAMVLTRSLHLYGYKAMVLRLSVLIQAIMDDTWQEQLDNCHILSIPNFYNNEHGDDPPFNKYQRMRVEEFLTEWTSSRRGLVVVSSRPLMKSTWWTPSFRASLKSRSREFNQ